MNDILNDLYEVILERKKNPSENSYTCYLFSQGLDKILKKIGEETAETIIAAKNDDKEALCGEICDLIYHLLIMAAEKNLPLEDIYSELERRSQKIGNLKKFKQTDKES